MPVNEITLPLLTKKTYPLQVLPIFCIVKLPNTTGVGMRKTARKLIKLYIFYILITSVGLFFINTNDPSQYLAEQDPRRFVSEEAGPDRAVLLEDREFSGSARIDIIRQAESAIDVAYYTVHKGSSAELFFANLLKAADRGVSVRILLDGMFHNLRGSYSELRHALALHPNIELKLYEPFSPLKPWTWHNRLHDKIIIADSSIFITGGRNIGDKYYLEDYEGDPVFDRDVLLLNSSPELYEESMLSQADAYFTELWDHSFSQSVSPPARDAQIAQAETYARELQQWAREIMAEHPEHFDQSIDWRDLTVPANTAHLITNPLERWNKRPWVWAEITRLLSQAEDSAYIQSPYIIPTSPMRTHIREIPAEEVTVLTNSLASSPNFFAISGYCNHRRLIAGQDLSLYEYHGEGSIHGKSFVIDSRLSLIGAFNIDPRSAYLSTESMVVIDSEPLAVQLEENLKDIISESLEVREDLSYKEDPDVEERPVSIPKQIIVFLLRIITYPFSFLL